MDTTVVKAVLKSFCKDAVQDRADLLLALIFAFDIDSLTGQRIINFSIVNENIQQNMVINHMMALQYLHRVLSEGGMIYVSIFSQMPKAFVLLAAWRDSSMNVMNVAIYGWQGDPFSNIFCGQNDLFEFDIVHERLNWLFWRRLCLKKAELAETYPMKFLIKQ